MDIIKHSLTQDRILGYCIGNSVFMLLFKEYFMKRRQFFTSVVVGTAAFAYHPMNLIKAQEVLILPHLPYPDDALEPYITAKTIGFHYGKHHHNYMDKLNQLLKGTKMTTMSLEEIIKTNHSSETQAIFNHAAQVWNHNFYWRSMRPKGGGKPTGKLAEKLENSFGSFETFRKEWIKVAVEHFGSGWVWLVQEKDKLKILATNNAETPLTEGLKPILTIDVWEHSYYLDYQNRRIDYVTAITDNLMNWEFAEKNDTA